MRSASVPSMRKRQVGHPEVEQLFVAELGPVSCTERLGIVRAAV